MESGIPFAGEVSPSSAVTTSNSLNSLSVTVSESIAAPVESSETRSLAQADDDTWESLKAGGCVEVLWPNYYLFFLFFCFFYGKLEAFVFACAGRSACRAYFVLRFG